MKREETHVTQSVRRTEVKNERNRTIEWHISARARDADLARTHLGANLAVALLALRLLRGELGRNDDRTCDC